jgi:dTDP-4-dehydrorhamnose reductase
MTDPAKAEIGDLLDQMAPFGDRTASVARCAKAVVRRAELLAHIVDDGTISHAQEAQQIAREAREEAAKARLLAERARRLAATSPEQAQEPPF